MLAVVERFDQVLVFLGNCSTALNWLSSSLCTHPPIQLLKFNIMDVQSEFDMFYRLLKSNLESRFVSEMLHKIEASEVLFLPPDTIETPHLHKVYTGR